MKNPIKLKSSVNLELIVGEIQGLQKHRLESLKTMSVGDAIYSQKLFESYDANEKWLFDLLIKYSQNLIIV